MKQFDAKHLINSQMDTQTILILFVEIVIIVIYLISLFLIVMRRAKKLLELHNRKYYLIVVFYIASKLVLCTILTIQIIVGMANNWSNIDPSQVQLYIKAGIILAEFSVIELFLVALETYLMHCFSVVADAFTKRRSQLLNIGLKVMQIAVALVLLIPLIIYITGYLDFNIINGMDIGLNLLIIISFLVTFFYLNFKMTGIMMENKLNDVIKRIYKVQLIILVSRVCALTFEIIIALYVLPHTFQEQINLINMKKEIVLAILFLGSVLFILITEGLPIMYSLRSTVIHALNHKSLFSEINQSIFTDHSSDLDQSLVDRFQDEDEPDAPSYKEINLRDFTELIDEKMDKDDSIWICKKGLYKGKHFLIRISKHQISSYIFQDIENEIENWNQLNLKSLSRLSYFCEGEIIHIVEKYYETNLDKKVSELSSQAEILRLALHIAEGIRELHDKQIPHGCLHPNHIFIEDSHVVFNGLGLHSLRKYLSLITGYTNKSIYTAIEHLRDKNNIILKPKKYSDIYSFGMILYEMVTKIRHYRQLSLREIQTKFAEESFRPKLPGDIKLQLKNLIRKCWNEIAERRPTIEEVIDSLRKLN